ncbi:MAG TPA: DUF86 domain-containing protein [Candidatus Nanoarchaeia archaeon]|nr:DUF86 domain-containing protein [Candidatus Nanoarchaeia archaeon]
MKKIKLVTDLQRYLHDLEEILPEEDEFLNNKSHQYSVSMLMMNIINVCVDLGAEVVSLKQLGYPETYRDIFQILEKEKIITASLSKKMKNLVGLRNLLAHEYGAINLELLYEQAKEINFVEKYLESIISYFD